MKTLILDTDFIINSIKNHIDIETSIKPLFSYKLNISYLDKTIEELRNKPFENLALSLIKKFKKIRTNKDKTVDELILEIADKNKDTIVATQDKLLKEKLKKRRIVVITIRQQRYITF